MVLSFMHDVHSMVPDHIRDFHPYRPILPDAELMRRYGIKKLHRLHNNENPLGPPPAVMEAMRAFSSSHIVLYPSGDAHPLRTALARRHGKNDPDQFLVGNGSSECILSVIKAFCRPGDNVITADKTFAVYEWTAMTSGCAVRLVPLKAGALDGPGILETMDSRTRVVFLCNPNNPTGTYWDTPTMRRFLDSVGGRRIVVIDEAYREYVDQDDFPDGMDLVEEYPNVLVFRTFSKIYAMAGLRVGYLAGQRETVEIVRKPAMIYSVNGFAQMCARAAIHDDTAHIRAGRDLAREGKNTLRAFFDGLGLEQFCGEGNFIMVRTPLPDELLYHKLMGRGIMVRAMTEFRFPNWIRVTVSTPDIMEEFMKAFENCLSTP